jgi:hypothetical protein
MNAVNGCTSRGGKLRRRSPLTLFQRSTLRTSPPIAIRYPSRPCSAGVKPVAMEHSAVAVVVGATVEIAPPTIEVSAGINRRRAWSCSQPNPSRINSTTWSAAATGSGIHVGSEVAQGPGPSNAGMIPRTLAPA